MMVKQDGTMYLIDFEQAARDGDKAWDVAVFLYYSGHYLPPLYGNDKAEAIAKAFIDGYLKAGGDVDVINKAGLSKYTRIFSIFHNVVNYFRYFKRLQEHRIFELETLKSELPFREILTEIVIHLCASGLYPVLGEY